MQSSKPKIRELRECAVCGSRETTLTFNYTPTLIPPLGLGMVTTVFIRCSNTMGYNHPSKRYDFAG